MMLHVLVLMLAVAGGEDPAAVTELRVEPVAGYTEVVVQTSGEVSYQDFLLTNPPRPIVDLKGARHALGRSNFEDIRRGGIVRVRTSQFRDDVVRIVVELTEPTSYTLTRQGGEIRVSFPNPEGAAFDSWASRAAEEVDPPVTAAPVPAAAEPQPTRPARPQQQGGAAGSPFRQEATPVSQMPRITVTFENTDIRDVLNNFADFTGKSFVPGAGVEGNVTANIRNQPWDLALKAILDAQGLTAVETGTGIIRVDKLENLQERQQLVQLQTQIFKISYAPVAELAQAIQPAISDRGKVIANEATNSIIVTDLEQNLEITQQLITDLDVRTPQVVISAKIIFVDRTDMEELGIAWDLKDTSGNQLNEFVPGPTLDPRRWELVDADFDGVPETVVKPLTSQNQISFSGASIAALANSRERLALPSLQLLTSAAIGDFRLFNFIEALERQDLSDIVAAPTIQTMDNQAANILVGERTPIRIVDYGAGGATGIGGTPGQEQAQAQFPQSTVQLEETGIKLEVTPHITHDRRVVMDLHAERSGVALAPGDIGFTFQTQEGTTRLILSDGETGVIGGLTVSEVTETLSGIPILMDLPLVGGLFRSRKSDETKQDLLILVTPHIVDDAVASN
jgi:type IV pilus assembly protein PilQ